MRYLLLVLFLFGCGESKAEFVDPAQGLVFTERDMDDVTFFHSLNFNGQIDFINDDSWVFTSHTNSLCLNKLNSSCRKVIAGYSEGVKITGRVTKTEFELSVPDINLFDSPDWVIIYQDWVRISPTDLNGNHPISTLKLKVFNGNLMLCKFDNSWQWGYDFGNNREGNNIDVDHSLHQINRQVGCSGISTSGINYIKILNFDDGFFQLYVDDFLVSHIAYQTKSPTESHVIQWGQYWDKGYNKENDPLKRIVTRIDNFKVSVAYQ